MLEFLSTKVEGAEFFECTEVTCTRTWGGSGPDTIVITGPDVDWRCVELDYDEDPPGCDGVRPSGGNWRELVRKYDIDSDDDYTECECSNRELVYFEPKKENPVKQEIKPSIPKLKL